MISGAVQQIIASSKLTVGHLGVPPLSGSVPDQVRGPSEHLLDDQVVKDDDGSIPDGLPQLFLTLLRDATTCNRRHLVSPATRTQRNATTCTHEAPSSSPSSLTAGAPNSDLVLGTNTSSLVTCPVAAW